MKPAAPIAVVSALLLVLLAAADAQQAHHAQGSTALSPSVRYPIPRYVESSTGLAYPAWESGGTELEMGDVNGDGFVDIVSIGDHGSPYINTQEHGIMVYFGNGQGTWSVAMNGNFGYGGIALGDVNGDGFIDAGYGMHHDYSGVDFGDQLLEVALGDGTGLNWTPWDDGLATNGETWGMFGTDFADIDCDGDLDVGSNSFGSGAGIHVYRNNGDGTWTQTFGFVGGNSNFDLIFGDVNNDGYADFAAEHQSGSVYLGNGAGTFTLADANLPSPGGSAARDGVDIEDVDGDGCDDISWCASTGAVHVWLWTPSGTWVQAAAGLPSSGPIEATQLCDLSSDGLTDLVVFGNGSGAVFLGDGAGNWTLAAQFSTDSPGYCYALRACADADRNGMADFVLVSKEGGLWSSYNRLRFYRESHAAKVLDVMLVSPRGHRVLRRGAVTFIDWRSAVPGGAPSLIDLELSTTGPGGPWSAIAGGLPDNGRFQWLIPAGLPASTECHIRITVTSGTEVKSRVNAVPFELR